MIKVGDIIQFKEEVGQRVRKSISNSSRFKFPLKVNKIIPCDSQGGSRPCKECPGYINQRNGCLGYDETYTVKAIPQDWDE